jgi:toxin HigB-1
MIRSFQHKGLEAFFRSGTKSGIQPHHASKLRIVLTALEHAKSPGDMSAPSWRFHALSGDRKGFFSVTISGNWRLIFRFEGRDAELIDYLDFH